MNKAKIILADDHLLFINGLESLLEHELWIEVIGHANNGKELLYILSRSEPDLILLDINMPVLNGFGAAIMIRRTYPAVKLIMLSTYNEKHVIDKAKQIGANGYLLKTCSKDELLHTIRDVLNNQFSYPSSLKGKEENIFNTQDDFLKQFALTKRELEILLLLKNNWTNQQVAQKLFLSIYTIETHRKNIMHKLGLHNPAALMKFIIEKNL
jgi:DNA-binding NarL/FixJ family response regulator